METEIGAEMEVFYDNPGVLLSEFMSSDDDPSGES